MGFFVVNIRLSKRTGVSVRPGPHSAREILKKQQLPVFLNFSSSRTRVGKYDYRSVTIFEKNPFSKCFSNSSGLKSVFAELRFRDGLHVVWTVSLTVEIKLCFQISTA